MKTNRGKRVVISMLAVFFVFLFLSLASAEDYEAMKGVNSVQVIFDMRDGIPKSAAVRMKLIHDTYTQLAAMKKAPVLVVVFMGSAVKLLSSNRGEFSAEDREYLEEIAGMVSKMSKDGIHLEACLAAAHYFGIDPASIQSEIKRVPNGWVSEIGYQARGYSLVPVY